MYNLHGLYCSCGSFGGLCNFKQGCLKYARTKLLRHDCNCASPQTLSPNKRNQACTPTENTWKNLPPSQSPRNVTLQNCTTPKTEVLTRQYADCSMSSVSNFNPVCHKPISVTSCRKFHCPPSKKIQEIARARNPGSKWSYGCVPRPNSERQCLQVGSTRCSATMRSRQRHFSLNHRVWYIHMVFM